MKLKILRFAEVNLTMPLKPFWFGIDYNMNIGRLGLWNALVLRIIYIIGNDGGA